MESEDSIQVVIRVRPCQQDPLPEFLTYSEREIRLGRNTFAFDRIFGEECQQADVFGAVGVKLVAHSLEGYNSCIFAYGQTGSGKTHTMVGQGDGLIQRSVDQLFLRMAVGEAPQGGTEYAVTCSYFEIYNEQLVDLLDPAQKKLTVREDLKKGVFVENLSEEPVESVQKAVALLNQGIRSRHIGETLMNRESSRSHAVYTLHIQCKVAAGGNTSLRTSKLHFVDLAGSERQKATACVGERLKEASNINKSLTTLGMVINSLSAESKRTHIPFRDSKLTFVLRDSLGGNSRTFIVATVSSRPESFQETLSTLKFAQRAKMVRLLAHINEESLSVNLDFLKAEIRRLKDELHRTRHDLQDARSNARSSPPGPAAHSAYTDLVAASYKQSVAEMNDKMSALLALLPAATEAPPLEPPALLAYLTDNHALLSTIHDKLSSFCELRQEVQAKASLEKLRLEDLHTKLSLEDLHTPRKDLEQLSQAHSRELSAANQSVRDLRDELVEREERLRRLEEECQAARSRVRGVEEDARRLRDFYEAKQSQLLLRLETAAGPVASAPSFPEEVQSLLEENRRLLESSTATIAQLKNDVGLKSQECEALARTLLGQRKANNHLSAEKEGLRLDLEVLGNSHALLEQRLQALAEDEGFRQRAVDDLLRERADADQRHQQQLREAQEQADLRVAAERQGREALQEEAAELASELDTLSETLEFKSQRLLELEAQLHLRDRQLEAAAAQHRQQAQLQADTIRQLEAAIEEARAVLARQVEAWNTSLAEEAHGLARATAELEHARAENAMLKEELRKTWLLAEQGLREKQQLEEAAARSEQQAQEAHAQVHSLEDGLRALGDEAQQLRSELGRAADEGARLRASSQLRQEETAHTLRALQEGHDREVSGLQSQLAEASAQLGLQSAQHTSDLAAKTAQA